MRKYVALLLLTGVIVVIGIILWQNHVTKQTSTTDNSVYSTLYIDAQGVAIKKSGTVDYSVTSVKELAIESGTYVKTDNTGAASVAFPDNSVVTLDPNTEIQINFSDTGINIFQVIGNTLHRVESVTQGKSYNVETSNVNAAVRGTVFMVQVPVKGESHVYVIENTVEVSQFEINAGTKKILNSQKVQTGDMVDAVNPVYDKPAASAHEIIKFDVAKIPDDFRAKEKLEMKLNRIIEIKETPRVLQIIKTATPTPTDEVQVSPTLRPLVTMQLNPLTTKTVINYEFEKVMQTELSKYTAVSAGTSICPNYLRTTPDIILNNLEAIETKYNINPNVRNTFGKLIYATALACKDQTISRIELASLQTLIPTN